MEWISVKDRLPDEKKQYLIFVYGKVMVEWFATDGNFFGPGVTYYEEITHWMPFPDPPK